MHSTILPTAFVWVPQLCISMWTRGWSDYNLGLIEGFACLSYVTVPCIIADFMLVIQDFGSILWLESSVMWLLITPATLYPCWNIKVVYIYLPTWLQTSYGFYNVCWRTK